MGILKTHRLAEISIGSVKNDSFNWIKGDGKPFKKLDAIDIDDEIYDSVYSIYKAIYSKIGSKMFLTDKDQTMDYTHWIILKDGTDIVGFLLCKKKDNGIKVCLTAAIETKAAKTAIKELNRKVFNVNGVFGEVSGPLEKVLTGHVPEVDASVAKKVLIPKMISRIHKDGKHYTRKIKNIGMKKKIMVGRPIV